MSATVPDPHSDSFRSRFFPDPENLSIPLRIFLRFSPIFLLLAIMLLLFDIRYAVVGIRTTARVTALSEETRVGGYATYTYMLDDQSITVTGRYSIVDYRNLEIGDTIHIVYFPNTTAPSEIISRNGRPPLWPAALLAFPIGLYGTLYMIWRHIREQQATENTAASNGTAHVGASGKAPATERPFISGWINQAVQFLLGKPNEMPQQRPALPDPTLSSYQASRIFSGLFYTLVYSVLGFFALLAMGYAVLQFIVIQGQGVETQGTIIAIERERTRDGLHYNVRYVFTVERRNYEGSGAISGADGAGLETMMPIPVRFLPFHPAFSVPVGHIYPEFGPGNRAYVTIFLLSVGSAVWLWRKQRRQRADQPAAA